jgi:hypothetical protein
MTFFALLEKHLTTLALENTPLALLLVIAVVALAVVVTVRYNSKINQAEADRNDAAIRKKQQEKIIQLIEAMPCVSKPNATWLQDEAKNGGRPPDYPIKCQYHIAKEGGNK